MVGWNPAEMARTRMVKLIKPKKRKSPRQRQTTKLDKLVGELIRLKHKHTCERCGRGAPRQLHVHHFHGRRNHSVRWEVNNLFLLCSLCHKLDRNSAHESPYDFMNWAKSVRGEDWYDQLLVRKNMIVKMDYDFMEYVLKKQINELRDE